MKRVVNDKIKKPSRPMPGSVAAPAKAGWTKQQMLAIGGIVVLILLTSVAAACWDLLMARVWPGLRRVRANEEAAPRLNTNAPPGPAPEGMVWIPGGEFYMGSEEEQFPDAGPVHKVYVDGFWMDANEVTNEEFAKFIAATGYVTEVEKPLDPNDLNEEQKATVATEQLNPYSLVFAPPPPDSRVDLRDYRQWWKIVYGACWNHPEGPKSDLKGREKHPAVHIAYNDAVAYCQWAKKRLPTEAEWEFAARGGLDRKRFSWGDDLTPDGQWYANVYQGKFPVLNTREDGHEGSAPVGSYEPNAYGLYDMAGNVWEWCADWYRDDYYVRSEERNPRGPAFGFHLDEPKRVQRGGSFLCAENYCQRYVVGSRHHGEPKSAANHIGFRCARDPR